MDYNEIYGNITFAPPYIENAISIRSGRALFGLCSIPRDSRQHTQRNSTLHRHTSRSFGQCATYCLRGYAAFWPRRSTSISAFSARWNDRKGHSSWQPVLHFAVVRQYCLSRVLVVLEFQTHCCFWKSNGTLGTFGFVHGVTRTPACHRFGKRVAICRSNICILKINVFISQQWQQM